MRAVAGLLLLAAGVCGQPDAPLRVAVVGGGPSGALAAILISQLADCKISLFERAPEREREGESPERGYNMAMFERAVNAMARGGIDIYQARKLHGFKTAIFLMPVKTPGWYGTAHL
jgi:2-polyprenyl-6-methoxyphenol hydroxylase-like FAD-dependent oxidoreductase